MAGAKRFWAILRTHSKRSAKESSSMIEQTRRDAEEGQKKRTKKNCKAYPAEKRTTIHNIPTDFRRLFSFILHSFIPHRIDCRFLPPTIGTLCFLNDQSESPTSQSAYWQ